MQGPNEESPVEGTSVSPDRAEVYEVFVRARRGLSHTHVGSVHAHGPDAALRYARDLYTRRTEGIGLWVVPASAIKSSNPDEKEMFFDPAEDKTYRHANSYEVPEGVEHL